MKQKFAIMAWFYLSTSLLQASGPPPNFETQRLSNWHQWRGPFSSGYSPTADPPLTWGEEENIKWKVALLGNGSSTAIVWENRIFLLTAVDTGKKPKDFDGDSQHQPESAEIQPRVRGKRGRKNSDRQVVLSVPRPDTLYQFEVINAIPLNSKDDITNQRLLTWHYARAAPYVSSPLLYDGSLYFMKGEQGILFCLDAATGEVLYGPQRLPDMGEVHTSLVGAAGRVYIVDRKGTTLVLAHGSEFRLLATNTLDDSFSASPAVVDNELFLRGQRYLYCIEAE